MHQVSAYMEYRIADDQDRCEWMNVSSGTGLPR